MLSGKNLKVAAEHWPPFFVIYEHPVYPGDKIEKKDGVPFPQEETGFV